MPSAGVATTTVPLVAVQVGWVTVSVGWAGGTAVLIVVFAAGDTQVLSVVLLDVIACGPTATLVNVADGWYAPPSIEYS